MTALRHPDAVQAMQRVLMLMSEQRTQRRQQWRERALWLLLVGLAWEAR